MIGQVLGDRYEIQQSLGKKAGRRTLLARDSISQELVVVKLLTFSDDFEWEYLKLFEREAQILQNLSHPAIPRYLDFFELDLPHAKGFALVQSYLEAPSLEQQLKGGRSFSEAEIKQLAHSVLDILIYLHERQPPVIHRDIKPSNILLTHRSGHSIGEVYLVDFGSVQSLAATEGGTITVVGTYGYMPPEQFGGRAVAASDLYSLGATLIYLVSGKHPADLPQKDLRIEFEGETNLSPALNYWLRRMIEPSLERRFSSATVALQALKEPLQRDIVLVKKPAGSKVSIDKNSEAIEIVIPPKGFNPSVAFLGLFAIAWNSMISFWTAGVLFAPFPTNLLFGLFSLPFWGAGVRSVITILFTLFGRVRLRINHEQIALTYLLFSFEYNRIPPSSRPDISKLELSTPQNSYELESVINIWAGKHKYKLSDLTEPEIEWLAEELQDWLGLKIKDR